MPSETSPVAEALRDLADTFTTLGVRWYLFGAQAAILYGVTRLTADVDVTVDLGVRPTNDLIAALSGRGFRLRVADIGGFVESTRVLPIRHERTGVPLDIVLAGPGLEELFFARASTQHVADVAVPVACPEDLVTMKILAGRPHDLEDVAAMIRRGHIDLGTVRETLALLERLLDRADLIPELERLSRP